jgi:hypothetical protein
MVMSFNPEWRDKAIDELVNNDINTIQDSSAYDDYSYIDSILRCGFKGYEFMTDDELMQELKDRDISTVFGDNDD